MVNGPDSGGSEKTQKDIRTLAFQKDQGVAGWIGNQALPQLTSSKVLLRIAEDSDEGKAYARTPVVILAGENPQVSERYGIGLMGSMLQEYVLDVNNNIRLGADALAARNTQLFILRGNSIVQVNSKRDLLPLGDDFEYIEVEESDVILYSRDTQFSPDTILDLIKNKGLDVSSIDGKKALAQALLNVTPSNNASLAILNSVDMQGPDYDGEDDTEEGKPSEFQFFPPTIVFK